MRIIDNAYVFFRACNVVWCKRQDKAQAPRVLDKTAEQARYDERTCAGTRAATRRTNWNNCFCAVTWYTRIRQIWRQLIKCAPTNVDNGNVDKRAGHARSRPHREHDRKRLRERIVIIACKLHVFVIMESEISIWPGVIFSWSVLN